MTLIWKHYTTLHKALIICRFGYLWESWSKPSGTSRDGCVCAHMYRFELFQGRSYADRIEICISNGELLLLRFSRVRLCATPQTAAHQASPSLGFSRQEHWSGLPFPSPVQESAK